MKRYLFEKLRERFLSYSIDFSSQRGSFIVGTLFFLFIIMMVAGFGVDISNYYNKKRKLQNIADGAALSAARKLEQYTDKPNKEKAYEAFKEYIIERQGKEKAEVYGFNQIGYEPNDYSDNFEVRRRETDCSDTNPTTTTCHNSSSDTFYEVGVVTYDHFEPLFLPTKSFGVKLTGMQTNAVAIVEPDLPQKQVPGSGGAPDCGLYVEQNFDIDSNNFNKNVSPALDVCGTDNSSQVNVTSNAHNTELGEIHLTDCANYNDDGTNTTDQGCIADGKDHKPSLASQYQNLSGYNINIVHNQNESQNWNHGQCSNPNGNYVEMETINGDPVEWSGTGDPVCVEKNQDNFTPLVPLGNNPKAPKSRDGKIVVDKGDNGNYSDAQIAVTKGNVVWTGQQSGVEGSIISGDPNGTYGQAGGGGNIEIQNNGNEFEALVTLGPSTNDIIIYGNNSVIHGDQDDAGGVALRSEGNIDLRYNNTDIYGIISTDQGNFQVQNNGGGNLTHHGISLVGQNMQWQPNSGATEIKYDKSQFDLSALDMGPHTSGGSPIQQNVDQPLFANVDVRLISSR